MLQLSFFLKIKIILYLTIFSRWLVLCFAFDKGGNITILFLIEDLHILLIFLHYFHFQLFFHNFQLEYYWFSCGHYLSCFFCGIENWFCYAFVKFIKYWLFWFMLRLKSANIFIFFINSNIFFRFLKNLDFHSIFENIIIKYIISPTNVPQNQTIKIILY
jgi:hypothetical protein